MSDYPPPPPAGGPPPPPPPPPGNGGYGGGGYGGGYGADPQGKVTGVPRPGELLDRFLARLIDGILFGVVVYGILGAIFRSVLVSDKTIDFSTGDVSGGSFVLYNIVFGVISTVLYLGYYALMESSRGQTLGKMAMKLKTVGPDGVSNPTLEQAVKRNIWMGLGILAILGTLGSLLGGLLQIAAIVLIVIGINAAPRRQTKFDEFAGGTQVLKVG